MMNECTLVFGPAAAALHRNSVAMECPDASTDSQLMLSASDCMLLSHCRCISHKEEHR